MSRQGFPERMSLQQINREAQLAHRRIARMPARAAEVVVQSAPVVSARSQYKGAEYSRIYSDWLAGLFSPDDEVRGDFRQLRARARDLARNNPYVGSYFEALNTNVVGPHGMGLKPQVRNRRGELDVEVNQIIKDRFTDYWNGPVTVDGSLTGVELEEVLLESTARDGEIFVRRFVGADFRHGLGLQGIDADLVDDNYNVQGHRGGVEIRMGIETDSRGRRVAYHVLDEPNYLPGFEGRGRIRIDAAEVIHIFRPKRVNQMRGVTWLARAMTTLKNVDRYEENELVASAVGAAKMGFLQWKEGSLGGGLPTDPAVSADAGTNDGASGAAIPMEAEPASIQELAPGMEFKEWNPEHPSTAYDTFIKNALRKASTGMGPTYAEITGDISDANYSNMRFGSIIAHAIYSRVQQWFIRKWKRQVFEWWLQSAILSGDLELPSSDWRLYTSGLWLPRGWPWPDRLKDADASAKLIGLGMSSRTRLMSGPRAEEDATFDEILEEIAEEERKAAEKGVRIDGSMGQSAAAVAGAPMPADEPAGGGGAGGPSDAPAGRAALPAALRERAGALNGATH